MGQVYLAEQPAIGRRVALKIIHKELAHDREMISRFFNEARAVTQIGHEHIVDIFDLGKSADDVYFIVMEFLDGRNLAQAIAQDGVLEMSRALHITAQVADALGAAHQSGIVHRDLKPDNVMLISALGDPDYVKVLDFGLAKMFTDRGDQPLTARGVIVGTPQYMAPESCETGKRTDYRADIYSLGVLLYQMTTGRVPFDGRTMGEVLIKQVSSLPPAPRGLNPEIAPAVEQITLRCLAKSPDARFQTMAELRHAVLDPNQYLASSPPIMRSASVSDLERARTLVRSRAQTGDPNLIQVDASRPSGPSDTQRNLAKPVVPMNQTMRIASPPPVRRPQRGRLFGLVGAGVLAVIVVLILLASSGSDDEGGGDGAVDRDQATGPASDGDMDTASGERPDRDAGAALERDATVRMHFKTKPSGAKIIDEQGLVLGVTPATIELPRDGRERTLTLRHPEMRDRTKLVHTQQDATFEIQLEPRIPERQRPPARDGVSP